MKNGYLIQENLISAESMADFEQTLVALLAMQAKKLGLAHDGTFYSLISALKNDRTALVEATAMLQFTDGGRRFMAQFTKQCAEILGCSPETIITTGPHFSVNFPDATQTLYTYHSEAHWYPKRRNFVNFWAPFHFPKHEGNGTMYIKPDSHTKHWDFTEFEGYKDQKGQLQYEVPDSEHADFPEMPMVLNPRDAVFFDRNLLHRSSMNTSDKPSFYINFRAYDFSKDLTVSAKTGERLYQDENTKYGRPNFFK
jgi:ectoine hydroxylase-related dioxygenase (phytanoyl-CoA dioxygenase family)